MAPTFTTHAHLERIERTLDRLEHQMGGVHSDVGQLRTEIRVIAESLRAHIERDDDRFGHHASDIRELKTRVVGVEDTGRSFLVTDAHATAIQAKDELKTTKERAFEWRKIVTNALITIAIAAVSILATLYAKGI